MSNIPVITIDGPSGAGKGTLSQLLAKKLGYHLLDSGALYRLLALFASNNAIDIEDESALVMAAENLDVVFTTGAESSQILLQGVNVTQAIRAEAISMKASVVAASLPVRAALLERQRNFLVLPGLVADGRDMGTTVFPDAPYKFFLTASAEARGARRFKQLTEKGESVDMTALTEDIRARDERDTTRKNSPLRPADDAVLLDSTDLSIQGVLGLMLQTIEQ